MEINRREFWVGLLAAGVAAGLPVPGGATWHQGQIRGVRIYRYDASVLVYYSRLPAHLPGG